MNNAPFRVGQRVIAVQSLNSRIRKGEIYVVNSVHQCPRCGHWFVDYGCPIDVAGLTFDCHKCGVNCKPFEPYNYIAGCEAFAPIDETYDDITAEIASQHETTEERPDRVYTPAVLSSLILAVVMLLSCRTPYPVTEHKHSGDQWYFKLADSIDYYGRGKHRCDSVVYIDKRKIKHY